MELRAFAEQILFATTLEAKLQRAGEITDREPGPAIIAPAMPGRPAELRFKGADAKRQFPGPPHIEDERERGRLLHFFANHELLAAELMALVLLRFPDAPPSFRRGVFETLQDEQEHTRWYVQRMRQCGIQFGELPVSGYFWRVISGMQSPMDYVAGLSLTFEQANLDFARQFGKAFTDAGDAVTGKLLDRIYRDEIGHVAHGLKWFRRWKKPEESDWQAFARQLRFPLSPTRAKGSVLNVEGRKAAGLDDEFIEELRVHAQSKGRTPNVFLFNPLAELFIAHGMKFTPGKEQARLACDLANVPQFLARQDDVVLVPRRPATAFLKTIQQAGFPLPEFIEVGPRGARLWPGVESTTEGAADFAALASRKIGGLRPWAWSPESVELLEPLLGHADLRPGREQCFNERTAELYSKAWSAGFLTRVLARRHRSDSGHSDDAWLCTAAEIGIAVNAERDALSAVAAIRARGHHRVVIKAALGLAGQNAIRLWEPEITEAHRRWIARAAEQGRELVVEPWLERVTDFSMQCEMTPRGLALRGWTGLINDRKGQFRANIAAPDFARRIPARPAAALGIPRTTMRLHSLYQTVRDLLEPELRARGFHGPVGIDAFVYRTGDGTARLKPVVEINPRYTMGRLLLELMGRTAPGTYGRLTLVNRATLRAGGLAGFAAYAQRMAEQFPLRIEGHPVPRLREGGICLNDPAEARSCLAVFRASAAAFGEVIGPGGE
jgi:uncharacterized ferritin-like protein (DUF455 family)